MVLKCPRCGLINPPEAQRCDCGYDFASRQVVGTYLSPADFRQSRTGGRGGFLRGCLVALVAAVAGAAVSISWELQSYRQDVAESPGEEFDRHGHLLVLLFLPRAVVAGALVGGLVGVLISAIVTLLKFRRGHACG